MRDAGGEGSIYSGMRAVKGIHHITAISGNAQQNLDFYAGVLGMRLVKKSVNQDDPGTYHLFYADAEGHPGTDLTFFPWEQLAPPVMGHGLANEVLLEVPRGSLAFWSARLEKYKTFHDCGDAIRHPGPSVHRSARVESGARRGRLAASVCTVGREPDS